MASWPECIPVFTTGYVTGPIQDAVVIWLANVANLNVDVASIVCT